MLNRLFLNVLSLLFMLPGVAAAQQQVGIVSFTVDNITTRFFENSMAVFFEYGIPGSMYGQTKPITGLPGDIYWPEIRIMIENGWEFGTHGHTHDKMTEMDDDTLELELGGPAAYIYRGTGVYPTTFASPHGAYDARVIERAKFYFDAHLRGWGGEGINLFESTDHFQINREQVSNLKTAEEVCADIEKAGREGYWLVPMFHRVVDEPEYEYENSVEQFRAIVECTADLRDRGIVRVMTVRDALEHVPHTPRERP